MSSSRLIGAGVATSVLVVLLGVLYFMQYKDPMMLAMAVQLLLPIWGIIGIIYVIRHGIPVRVVTDERRREP